MSEKSGEKTQGSALDLDAYLKKVLQPLEGQLNTEDIRAQASALLTGGVRAYEGYQASAAPATAPTPAAGAREITEEDRAEARRQHATKRTEDAAAEADGARQFEVSGMLWFINRLLAPFGWHLNVIFDLMQNEHRVTARHVPGSMFTPGTPDEALRVHFLQGINADIARVRTDVAELSAADRALVGAVEGLCDAVDEVVDAEYAAKARERMSKACAPQVPLVDPALAMMDATVRQWNGLSPQVSQALPGPHYVRHAVGIGDGGSGVLTHLVGSPCLLCTPQGQQVREATLERTSQHAGVPHDDPDFSPEAFFEELKVRIPPEPQAFCSEGVGQFDVEGVFDAVSKAYGIPKSWLTGQATAQPCAAKGTPTPSGSDRLKDTERPGLAPSPDALAEGYEAVARIEAWEQETAQKKAAEDAARAVLNKHAPGALSPITDATAAVYVVQDALSDLELARAEHSIELTRLERRKTRHGLRFTLAEQETLQAVQDRDDELAVEIARAKLLLRRTQVEQERATRRMFAPARFLPPQWPLPRTLQDYASPYTAPEIARDGRGLPLQPRQPVGVIPAAEATAGGIEHLQGAHGYFRTGFAADQGEYGMEQAVADQKAAFDAAFSK